MSQTIVRNAAKCRKCGDVIESKHRHDFVYCSCNEIFVDGGRTILRRGAKDVSNLEDLSITVEGTEDDE